MPGTTYYSLSSQQGMCACNNIAEKLFKCYLTVPQAVYCEKYFSVQREYFTP
jgi:hypothetical protein